MVLIWARARRMRFSTLSLKRSVPGCGTARHRATLQRPRTARRTEAIPAAGSQSTVDGRAEVTLAQASSARAARWLSSATTSGSLVRDGELPSSPRPFQATVELDVPGSAVLARRPRLRPPAIRASVEHAFPTLLRLRARPRGRRRLAHLRRPARRRPRRSAVDADRGRPAHRLGGARLPRRHRRRVSGAGRDPARPLRRCDRRLPDVGERCVVVGWPLGEEGRKLYAGTALYGEDGRPLARARATWIVPRL